MNKIVKRDTTGYNGKRKAVSKPEKACRITVVMKENEINFV